MASGLTMSCKSAAECEQWMKRIHELQTNRLTPERREELRARVERSRMAEYSRRKCKAVKFHSVRSVALVSEGLRQMGNASAPSDYAAVQHRWMSAQSASEQRQEEALSRMVQSVGGEAGEAVVLREEEEDEQEEANMMEAAELVGGPMEDLMRSYAEGPGATDEFSRLLEQLRIEPTGDEELAAKFAFYEQYGSQVEKMRESLFGLYEENKATLPDAVNRDMGKQLKKIDNDNAMGIQDDARGWFVYHMMKQAGANNETMSLVMERFEKKLEFLSKSDQDECPICLDRFSETVVPETLGCCHKVCGECWAHWSAVMGGHPFCPLCKNDDFVEALHRHAASS